MKSYLDFLTATDNDGFYFAQNPKYYINTGRIKKSVVFATCEYFSKSYNHNVIELIQISSEL